MFLIFVITTIAVASVATYFAQMKQYKAMCKDRIRDVGDYLLGLIMEDPQDYLNFQNYYDEHCKDIKIPFDFNEYTTARDEFFRVFHLQYPGKTFRDDVMPDELNDELKNMYYTYRQEYWILTFEKSRKSFKLPYTYYLIMHEDSSEAVYMIDGERTEDPENPGYLYMGDTYYEDPTEQKLLWDTYHNAKRYDEVYEWDNAWGNTYSCYTPLIIDGKCIGLIGTEINVSDVRKMILKGTLLLCIELVIILVSLAALLLFFINKYHISRINHLSAQIDDFSSTRAYDTVNAIREYPYGNDEISVLAANTADMIQDLQIHEGKVAQAAQFKSDFLANMSHEIRTPMNAIVGLTEMILKEKLPEQTEEYFKQIYNSSRSMLVIIGDILDFSKIEAGTVEIIPAVYNVKKTIAAIVNVTSIGLEEKPVVMKLDIDPALPEYLRGDNLRIGQVLTNVLSNAVKFTREGSVNVGVTFDTLEDNKINLKISVADTGIGIMKEDYEKIFESFSQIDSRRNREVEGTGLGLAITQRLIRLMNGTIEVESEYGVGSVFMITIPQDIAAPDEYKNAADEVHTDPAAPPRAPGARLLVVDDNNINLYVAKNLLGLYEIKPTCVISGEQALMAVDKNDYDLILMDYMMPEMDGIEATHRIREEHPQYKDIPIIAFTANAVEEARELLLKKGMDDFLAKPVKATELEAILKKWLPDDLWESVPPQ